MIGKKINQLATELAPASTDLTIIGDPISGVSKKITIAQLGAIFSGAVSFYDNFAAFPATGDINVIYCAKDTKKLYLWSGSAYVEVFPSQALLDTYQLRSEKGNANGYASLDSGGKVPISQLPSSIMEYKGTWNAATNTPTLANGTGDTGDVYICNVAGTVNFGAGPLTFAVGDYVIYSGSIWQRSSGAVGTVTSVGASITGDSITISNSPISTSGTLAFAFAGNSTQYVNGAGNLVTFPGIINEAQNLITEVYNKTGATLTKGTVVYINGGQGNLPSVTKALATGDSTSAQTYGIVRNDITNNNNGYVVVAGRISDLDTQAYTEGTQLYLSPTTAGTFTSTKPYAPQHLVYVGIVVRAHPTQGVVEVKIQNGYELDELHNVAAQTPTNNDGLFWESATNLWKNKSIATILGYTPQAQLNGTGFVKASGTTITYDNNTYVTIDTFENITASKNFTVGLSLGSAGGTNQASVFANTNSIYSGSAGTNIFGFNTSNNIYFGKGLSNGGVIAWNNSTSRTYNLPDADGTIALVGGSGVGTVTSVAALTIGTTGTDITSTVANSTTTPVITLNVPTASATNRGALSSADWTTFNNKQNTLTNPVTGTGTTNYIAKFTGTSTIGNSLVFDNGTNVGIGTNSPTFILDVNGTGRFTGALTGTSATFSSSVTATNAFFYASNGFGLAARNAANTDFRNLIILNSSNQIEIGNNADISQIKIGTALQNNALTISGTGQATFVSSVTAQGIQMNGTGGYGILARADGINSAGNGAYIGFVNIALNRYFISQLDTNNDINYYYFNGSSWSSSLMKFSNTGAATFSNLAGTGTRMVVADANGLLSTQAIGSGAITGSGTTNYIPKFTGTSAIGNSQIFDNGTNVGIGTTSPLQRLHVYNSASSSAAIFQGSSNSYIQLGVTNESYIGNVSGALLFEAGGSERMRISSGGNVGIGTTSPGAILHSVKSGTAITGIGDEVFIGQRNSTGHNAAITIVSDGLSMLRLTNSASTELGAIQYSTTSNFMALLTNSTERMRITSGGNVGIGTTSPNDKLSVVGNVNIGNNYTASYPLDVNSTSDFNIRLRKQALGGTVGILFETANDFSGTSQAWIRGTGAGSNGTSFLTFGVGTSNGSSTGSEVMRITSGGNLLVGTTSNTTADARLSVEGSIITKSYGGSGAVTTSIAVPGGFGGLFVARGYDNASGFAFSVIYQVVTKVSGGAGNDVYFNLIQQNGAAKTFSFDNNGGLLRITPSGNTQWNGTFLAL